MDDKNRVHEWHEIPLEALATWESGLYIIEQDYLVDCTPLLPEETPLDKLKKQLSPGDILADVSYSPCPACGRTWWSIQGLSLECLNCGHCIPNHPF